MSASTRFREYSPDQLQLLPSDLCSWFFKDYLVYFVLDVVRELDLSSIYASYDGSQGGRPPYDPRLMVGLLLYGYCSGVTSSRKIEQATYDSVAFRVISVDQHPDHDTISAFRERHLDALNGMFVEVLLMCLKVKLGHVALDGTKIQANASKHKAMSYGRMKQELPKLEAEVRRLLDEARAVDAAEDELYGKGKRGNELPEEWVHKETRMKKIREGLAELRAEAEAEHPEKQAEYERKVENRKTQTTKPGAR